MKVLVLDNDPGMRELMVLALGMQQLEARPAATVEEAEAELEAAEGLLMDFHLGGGHSGAEVARRWAGEGRLPRFWLVTGTPEDPEVQGLGDLPQLQGVVGKPFRLLGLAEAVARILVQTAAGEAPQVLGPQPLAEPEAPDPGPGPEAGPKPLAEPGIRAEDPQPSGPASVG